MGSHPLFALMWLVGFGLFAWGSFFRRLKSAPPVGSSHRRWPPGPRDWFTPSGYRARVIGFVLLTVAMVEALLRLVLKYG